MKHFSGTQTKAMDNGELEAIVDDIVQTSKSRSGAVSPAELRAHLSVKHKRFATSYPKLFEMCLSPTFDADQFRYMLAQMDLIQAKQVSFEDSTKKVCENLNERYILPLVGAPDANIDVTKMEHLRFTTTKRPQ